MIELRDGIRVHSQTWEPQGAAIRARIFGLHGILEHSGRYRWFAEQLTARGYALEMIDLRGHGRSEGPRVAVRDIEQYLEDLDDVFEFLKQTGRTPRFLFGHSMGAGLLILWTATRKPPVRGLVLSAPPVVIAVPIPRWLISFGRLVERVLPGLRLVQLKIARRYGRHAVSRDPEVLRALQEDPLVYRGPIPLRTGLTLVSLQERLQEVALVFETPFLLLQGTEDRLASPKGATLFYKRSPSPDKTLRMYEGLYHEVLSEPEKETIVQEILAWLEARLGAVQGGHDLA